MASRPRRHPLDPERPARYPDSGPSTLPPRPPVPYNNNSNTWRRPPEDDRRYPDYSNQAGPSRSYAPMPYREHPQSARGDYGNHSARGGSSWQPTESYRPSQQYSSREYNSHPFTSTRSAPPVQPKPYVPFHLRTPVLGAPAPTPYPHTPSSPAHFSGGPKSPVPAFEIPLPDDEYMEVSVPFIAHEDDEASSLASKLLVLDLNGTLVYRNKSHSNSRNAYPRPYLGCFFKYIYRPQADENQPRPWEVFVWSSAQPHNVRVMLESTFDPAHIEGLWDVKEGEVDLGENGKVLGVWARDKMGLSEKEYAHKTQTTKDLRKVEAHFESRTGFKRFPLETILLLDDSPLKAVYQPWNQLVMPEYDRDAYHASSRAADQETTLLQNTTCDQILLAVIGILEATSSCENIPAWVRAGGLKKPDVHQGADKESTDPTWFGTPDGPAAGAKPRLDSLPTHDSFTHWFQDDKLVQKWIEKGKQALELYGIPLEHGLEAATPSARGSPAPHSHKIKGRNGLAPPGHTVPTARRRGYSPSQPADGDLHDTMSNLTVSPPNDQSSLPELDPATGSTSTSSRLSNRNTKQSGRSQHADQPGNEDTWRTFRSIDVSEWLAEFAERSSLNQQDRHIILQAGALVRDQRSDEEVMADAFGEEDMDVVEVDEGDTEEVIDPFAAADITEEFFGSTSATGRGMSEAERAIRREHVAALARKSAASRVERSDRGDARGKHAQEAIENSDNDEDEDYEPDDDDEEANDRLADEEPEPANAQYPLDHPTSSFDLPPCILRGNRLTKIEIARYFARAAGNPDPIQQLLLGDLVSWEVKHRAASENARKKPNEQMIGSSLRHMEKVRNKIVINEDIRDFKTARARDRRKEIKHYRDQGLEPPPLRPLPKHLLKRQKPKKKKKDNQNNKNKNQPNNKPNQNNKNKDQPNNKPNNGRINNSSNGNSINDAKNPTALSKKQKKKNNQRAQQFVAEAHGHQMPSRNGNGGRNEAGPSLVNTPRGPRADTKPIIKTEPQSRSHSSKRRASDANGGPVKVQRFD